MPDTMTQQEIALPFGKELMRQRRAAHLTRTALAERCGVSDRQIGNLEREECFPRRQTWDKLRRALPDLPSWR